ncbi:immunity-related GTPase family M protein 1-like [Perognathus longimembris pacificus]|uniref:immunity-related GTPase family M protein 1-like n=1 Tax=Perognathus longimembris pacificus TaxID=214514 RepID=UPI002018C19A|nr:immunity-related GTPase family M protein 1-like [Perognathus longimembris pacificus]
MHRIQTRENYGYSATWWLRPERGRRSSGTTSTGIQTRLEPYQKYWELYGELPTGPAMNSSQEYWEAIPLLTSVVEDPMSHDTLPSASFNAAMSYHTGWSRLPEGASRNTERALKEGKLPEVASIVKETMEIVSRTPVSIAVTGDSGNGMSSFINALRIIGLEETLAPTGVVRTTQTRAGYSSSRFPNVVLWDLPGLGVTSQSMESYVEEMRFSQYDFFIIIASEQFSTNHLKLAQTIQRMGKKFYVVWTKLDRDLSTSVLPEARLLQTIRENIKKNLQKKRVHEPPIFLVSNIDPLFYDFPKLRDTLKIDLSNIRRSGPLESLSHLCGEIINEKVASLRRQVVKESRRIKDADDLGEVLEAYHLLFGMDGESLLQVAKNMGKAVTEYMAIMKSQDLYTLCGKDWQLKFMTCLVMNMLLSLFRCIPFLGGPVIRFFRHMRYRHILELVAQDTKTILRKILEDSIIPT